MPIWSIVAPGGYKKCLTNLAMRKMAHILCKQSNGLIAHQIMVKSTPLGAAKEAVNHDTIAKAYSGEKFATMLNLMDDFSDSMTVVSHVLCGTSQFHL